MMSKKRVVLLTGALSLALHTAAGAAQPNSDHPGKGKPDRAQQHQTSVRSASPCVVIAIC